MCGRRRYGGAGLAFCLIPACPSGYVPSALRLEFEGALYHVTSRGDRREPIFEDDADRQALLDVLAQGVERFDAVVFAYCLMGNHYPFLLQTHRPNLSRLMRRINGVYTQAYNRRHGKVGHLFQGWFKAVLVDEDAYLLEVCRYVRLKGPGSMFFAAQDPSEKHQRHLLGRSSSEAAASKSSLAPFTASPVLAGGEAIGLVLWAA